MRAVGLLSLARNAATCRSFGPAQHETALSMHRCDHILPLLEAKSDFFQWLQRSPVAISDEPHLVTGNPLSHA